MAERKAVIADGPLKGYDVRMGDPVHWSPMWCCKTFGGQWEHYNHAGDGVYRYAGRCASVGHEHVEYCDHTWYDDERHDGEHRCDRPLPHDTHFCCCGAEVSGG